ncbi:ABC transporter G family member 31 [Tripterygium wilfordii]|uniref:ABC transporter G family member 31 n=1 Tax=Tripterygium wilfordii TaxID=458696 RepID=A0A7J7CYK8_TRIWF|nr:ABC transporter G family member 31 [Tripterygium wilfordii]
MAASNRRDYFEFLELERGRESFAKPSNADAVEEDEVELMWAALDKLPSQKRGNYAVLRRGSSEKGTGEDGVANAETVDVRKLTRSKREFVVKEALATNEQDNYRLLSAIKERLDRVGLEVPKVEVRFENLNIQANVQIGSRALPTLINAARDTIENILTGLRLFRPRRHSLTILNNVNGVVKPGRMTLLLGPPGSGKSSLLLALAGKLDKNLKKSRDITYNGHNLNEFCVQRTSAYISQTDNHIAELTVRETLDFAARCQGASEGFGGYMDDLARLEKERNIRPSPEIDAFMKASSVGGTKHSVSTDYVLKVLGLDVCSETLVGNDMLRGISGGQRKRVTTGLSLSHQLNLLKVEATILTPAPETFDLFDDLLLLSEGHVVYQGPRADVLEFFESLGFQLPPRKGVADFLQEVTSKKDQAQYWADPSKPYVFLPVPEIAKAFANSRFGRSLQSTLSVSYDKSKTHPSALSKEKYAVSKYELLKACFSRELLLISRHRFLYTFRTCQVAFIGFVTCTIFLRTELHPADETNGNLYLAALFVGLVHIMFNGFSELPLTISRLPVFYKQRDNFFHPAWAWSLASWILRVPYSILEAFVWSCVVYYTIGFAPSAGRFFCFLLILLAIHQMALGLFRLIAAIARDMVLANTFGSAAILVVFLLGGFIMPKRMLSQHLLDNTICLSFINALDVLVSDEIKPWWIWGYWVSPLSYGQNAISVNEFTATRWMKMSHIGNVTVGYNVLRDHGIPTGDYWYWLGFGVLFLYGFLFNNLVTLALTYLNRKFLLHQLKFYLTNVEANTSLGVKKKGMILPFQPLTMTFLNVNYFVDMPKLLLMKRGGSVIYGGKLGVHSKIMTDYFQGINGISPIPNGYNPATWMLEVTTPTVEERIGIDFSKLYTNSEQYRELEATIKQMSAPTAGSEPLKFSTTYSQTFLGQFLICLRKQNLVYWRTPSYNLMRLTFTAISALIFGTVFWNIGSKSPIAWTLRGIVSSQLGDVESMIEEPEFTGTVKAYLEANLGYGPGMIGVSVVVLVGFCLLFFSIFVLSVKLLNFQKR